MAFGFGFNEVVAPERGSPATDPLASFAPPAAPEGYAPEEGRAPSIIREAPLTAIRDIPHMGVDAMGAADQAAMLDAAYQAGRTTVQLEDIENHRETIRNLIGSNMVAPEILDRLPPDARMAAEPVVEAEMRRMGRNPDETAGERDQRVAREQEEVQQAMQGVIAGAGLIGALDNMTGQAQPQPEMAATPERDGANPFAGLLAGFSGPKLAVADMGETGQALADHANLQHGLATGEQRERGGIGIA